MPEKGFQMMFEHPDSPKKNKTKYCNVHIHEFTSVAPPSTSYWTLDSTIVAVEDNSSTNDGLQVALKPFIKPHDPNAKPPRKCRGHN